MISGYAVPAINENNKDISTRANKAFSYKQLWAFGQFEMKMDYWLYYYEEFHF